MPILIFVKADMGWEAVGIGNGVVVGRVGFALGM